MNRNIELKFIKTEETSAINVKKVLGNIEDNYYSSDFGIIIIQKATRLSNGKTKECLYVQKPEYNKLKDFYGENFIRAKFFSEELFNKIFGVIKSN